MGCVQSKKAELEDKSPEPILIWDNDVQEHFHDTQDILIALYDYNSRTYGDLSFKKGDLMLLLDKKNYDWWFVQHQWTHEMGYVPRNFVAKRAEIESEEWFVGRVSRNQAEILLLDSRFPRGTFLIREREENAREYALSVKDCDSSGNEFAKHYKIKPLDDNRGYFITTRRTFQSLQDLVKHYSESSSGLCCRLTSPAPRPAPTRPDLSSKTQENWEIPRDQLTLKQKIGDGNFGEVFYAKWRGVVGVAVKSMKPGTMSPEAFLEEAQIMKQCDHPNLVKLYGVCTREEPVNIVTEHMTNGSLLDYLRKEGNKLEVQTLIAISSQVANGMKYLEDRKLIHRDLAARNVLVGDKIARVPVVKIADFGLARRLIEEEVYRAKTGSKFPIKWSAPEASQGIATVKSDVWSFGILMYEIMSKGKVPYLGMNNDEVNEQVEDGYRMPMPSGCPEAIYQEVMLKCWEMVPERRPTFDTLYHYLDDFFVSAQRSYALSRE